MHAANCEVFELNLSWKDSDSDLMACTLYLNASSVLPIWNEDKASVACKRLFSAASEEDSAMGISSSLKPFVASSIVVIMRASTLSSVMVNLLTPYISYTSLQYC